MVFPSCGKILVIDDKIEEALPLLSLFSKNGVCCSYYSGAYNEFPDEPFSDVRLVFCDLRFSVAQDVKSVASNIIGILQKLISENNGPYILIIWSSHIPGYLEGLRSTISQTCIKPEFILELDKTKYFSSSTSENEELQQKIADLDLDYEDRKKVLEIIRVDEQAVSYQPNDNALSEIEKELREELKKANLLHLFVIWENAISGAAIETVNAIYNQIPKEIPSEKRLNAMLFYLSHFQLEKQFDNSSEEEKLSAAIMTLNQLFSAFSEDVIGRIQKDKPNIEVITNVDEVKKLSEAKFNKWSMLRLPVIKKTPGSIYEDSNKLFKFHGWIGCDAKTKKEGETYGQISEQLLQDASLQYVLIDVSAECDVAQRKQFVAKVIPGIVIPAETLKQFEEEKKVKKGTPPEYIFKLGPIEYGEEGSTKDVFLIFNLNQLHSVDASEFEKKSPIMCLSTPIVASIKQRTGTCISKAGYAAFGQ